MLSSEVGTLKSLHPMAKHIDPSKEQFDAFRNLPRDTPIMMLNMIRLRGQAVYADGRVCTGAEAYANYACATQTLFNAVGGTILWRGRPETVLIGRDGERWDKVFIAQYPSAAKFLEMVTSEEYQALVFHRQAGVEDSKLIRLSKDSNTDDFFA